MTSLARVFFSLFAARVTRDVAAPDELAVALPPARELVSVVAAAAAQHITAVRAEARAVTQPSGRAHRSRLAIIVTIVRRSLQVHQITLSRLFMSAFRAFQL